MMLCTLLRWDASDPWGSLSVFDQILIIVFLVSLLTGILWEIHDLFFSRAAAADPARTGLLGGQIAGQGATQQGPPTISTVGTISSRLGTMVFDNEQMTTTAPPDNAKLQQYAQFVNKAQSWAHKGVLNLDPNKKKDLDCLLRSEKQIDKALSKLTTIRDACARAGAPAKFLKTKAESLYRAIWSHLWKSKLLDWQRSHAQQSAQTNDDRDNTQRRVWGFRIATLLLLLGLSIAFGAFIIPRKLLAFKGATFIVVFGLILGLQYILFLLALLFVSFPKRSKTKGTILNADDGVAFLIASHRSEPDSLREVLAAAKKRFSPACIFVCDNDNTTKPNETTRAVCREAGVNFVFIPLGNKTFSFYWTAKYWLGPNFKYVMMIDDDVVVPSNLEVPINRLLSDVNVAALAYTIRSAPNSTDKNGVPRRNFTVTYQDFEYIIAGYLKVFQSALGSCVAAHGAISLWKRPQLIQVLDKHNTMFHGEDLQMGLVLHSIDRKAKIKCVASECVATNVPVDFFYLGTPPPGLKSLCTQRVRSWDATAHRFIGEFLSFVFLGCFWPRHTIAARMYIVVELVTVVQDWTRVFVFLYYIINDIATLVGILLRVTLIGYILNFIFNSLRLAMRPDLRQRLWVVVSFPGYQLLLSALRLYSMIYAAVVYAANQPNLPTIAHRLDTRDLPPFLDGMPEYATDWEDIWDPQKIDSAKQPGQSSGSGASGGSGSSSSTGGGSGGGVVRRVSHSHQPRPPPQQVAPQQPPPQHVPRPAPASLHTPTQQGAVQFTASDLQGLQPR